MKWMKRDGATTIEEVVVRNTGLSVHDLTEPQKDPYVQNLDQTAEYLMSFDRDTHVTIMGDYDADGITGSAIMYKLLQQLGFHDIVVRLPKRFSEGYGLSEKVIDEISEGLLITVDNGVVANSAIAKAKAKGISVIVIDHHMGDPENLPDADQIIDPNVIEGSEFCGYCGAGLAYRLAEKCHVENTEMLGLAAVGTVVDVMDLTHDNRRLVLDGLAAINERKVSAGFLEMLDALNLSVVTETDLGFSIGPVINAAGRMLDEGAYLPFTLLSDSYESAGKKRNLAIQLSELNQKRKEEVANGMEIAKRIIAEECYYGDRPLIIAPRDKAEALHEGIVGILAGRLAEEMHVPCFVLTYSQEKGILKGSGRSYGDVNLKNVMDASASHMVRYGGHAGAGGLSVKETELEDLRMAMQEAMSGIEMSEAPNEDYYDLEIRDDQIQEMLDEMQKFAPFGQGNPKIRFKINNYRLTPRMGDFYKLMGADGSTVKLLGNKSSAIGFGKADRYKALGEPKLLTLYGSLSINHFQYSVENQIELLDFDKEERAKTRGALADLLAARMK